MFKFLKNLFNFGKRKDFLEVEMDKEKGIMKIRTNRDLSHKEIMDILIRELGDD